MYTEARRVTREGRITRHAGNREHKRRSGCAREINSGFLLWLHYRNKGWYTRLYRLGGTNRALRGCNPLGHARAVFAAARNPFFGAVMIRRAAPVRHLKREDNSVLDLARASLQSAKSELSDYLCSADIYSDGLARTLAQRNSASFETCSMMISRCCSSHFQLGVPKSGEMRLRQLGSPTGAMRERS